MGLRVEEGLDWVTTIRVEFFEKFSRKVGVGKGGGRVTV